MEATTKKAPTLYMQFVRYIINDKKGSLDLALQLWRQIPENTKKIMKEKILSTKPNDLFECYWNPGACPEPDVELKEETPLILTKDQYPSQKKGRKTKLPCIA